MRKGYTCIICPNGCEIEAEIQDGQVLSVRGNTCDKGEEYVRQEVTAPMRTIATSVRVEGGELPLASVRLTAPIPKGEIFPVMEQVKKIRLQAPVKAGTVILEKVCGLDSSVVVTKNVEKRKNP